MNESINLAELPAHQATRKAIEARIAQARKATMPLFHQKLPSSRNCSAVARSGFSRKPSATNARGLASSRAAPRAM